MKTLKLLILILLPILAKSQQVIINHPGYVSYYNTKTKIPDSVKWVASPHTKVVSRKGMVFHASFGQINLTRDYKKSGFDIGHNADFSDQDGDATTGYQSFEFDNAYPQRPNCNRKTWLALEAYTRSLNIPVRVKVSYQGISSYIGPDNVAVPEYCLKWLTYNGKTEFYKIPNADTCILHPFTYYRVK